MDRADYLHGGLTPVECGRCTASVLVKKHSLQQTSVQWSTEAVHRCAEFAIGDSAQIPTCLALRDSIELAVKLGRLGLLNG
ncbi:hypothetical protein Rhe02_43090 [Rhizocola hellebori]|uniref:Uncharacterized protein n=1 Tax=Rhizocola hellebori TaxID=1392758 RepID=A0A8J3QAD9_9ACTN|nr:hypothetical protein [Rhizocola hellebori]GIH06242.1 hypothetical protein Rhe02_43090 [Rhizocola hellebori]